MITFIVIGRNIERTVELCLNSIINCVDNCKLLDAEIIYVDSKSTDKTLQIIRKCYPQVKSISITGGINAAVGRNVGAKESIGNDLIFLDGDMELNSQFVQSILNHNKTLKYDFVSGGVIYHLYDADWKYLEDFDAYKKDKDHIGTGLGGAAFAVKKELWCQMGGMNTYYARGEDMDFWFRLSNAGYPLLRRTQVIGIHHTISYFDKKRFPKMVLDGGFLYPGLLVRDNIRDKRILWYCIRNFQTAIFLIISLLFCMFKIYYLIFIYLFLIVARSFLRKKKENKTILFHVYARFIYDIMFIVGFAFFYPKKIELRYVINN